MKAGFTRGTPHPMATARAKQNLSLRALGDLTGVSYVTISHIENGRVDPKAETKAKLAEALGVSEADLWPVKGPGSQPHPDQDPDVPDLRGVAIRDQAVIYLDRPRVDYVNERGQVTATETPGRLVIYPGGHTRVEVRRRTPSSGRPRGRRTTKASARGGSSDDDPAPEPPPASRRP